VSGFDSRQITQLLWADEKTGRAETPEALLRKVPDFVCVARRVWICARRPRRRRRGREYVINISAQAILRKLSAMWKALSKAEQQKWKNDAPMVKARGKRKEPPPDAELLARYEACGARVGLPSRPLTRATAGTNLATPRRRPARKPPNRPRSSGSAARRPSPSTLSTDGPSDVRRHGGLRRGRGNDRETARRESETPRDARH
jgi:hypothetical protein